MTPEKPTPCPELSALTERASLLRRQALQTRLRLAEQRAALERVTSALAIARESVRLTAPAVVPPPTATLILKPAPATLGGLRTASISKEAAADSAPVAASLRVEAARHAPALLRALVPFAAIGAAALAAHARIAPRLQVVMTPAQAQAAAPSFAPGRDALVRVEPPPPAEDDGSAEALQLAHEWRPEGHGPTLLERLGGELDRPGLPPAWTVERTGPRGFLVRFAAGGVSHDFEVDLETRSVRPSGEGAALFAGR